MLQIAHHRLEGKIVEIREPLILLKSTKSISFPAPPPSSSPPPLDHTLSSSPVKARIDSSPEKKVIKVEEEVPKIEMVTIIKRKIVFSKRPEPIAHLISSP